jgi:hypothetical protein
VSNLNGFERSWTLKSQTTTWRHYELLLAHELFLEHGLFLDHEMVPG